MKIENWCGYDIRFVEKEGEWYAVLKDICDALDLRTDKVASRLNPNMIMRVPIEMERVDPRSHHHPSKVVVKHKVTMHMLAINEFGIYEALFASRRLEARKFRLWTVEVLQKLRKQVGLQGYEVMKMTDPEIQSDIDFILDTLFYDPETGMVMQSVTVQGGDVEQVPYLG